MYCASPSCASALDEVVLVLSRRVGHHRADPQPHRGTLRGQVADVVQLLLLVIVKEGALEHGYAVEGPFRFFMGVIERRFLRDLDVDRAALEERALPEAVELALAVQQERQGLARAPVHLAQRPLALVRPRLGLPEDHLPGREAVEQRQQHLLDEPVEAVRHTALAPRREQQVLAELGLLDPALLAVGWHHVGILHRRQQRLGQQPVQRAGLAVAAPHGDELANRHRVVAEDFPAVPVGRGERQEVRDADREVLGLRRRLGQVLLRREDVALLAESLRGLR